MVEIEVTNQDISILSLVLSILTLNTSVLMLFSNDLRGGETFGLISLLFIGFFLIFVKAKKKPS